MGAVRGVVIEGSLLFDAAAGGAFEGDDNGIPCIPPQSSTLLRRLKYSQLRVGICSHEDISPKKASFLAGIAASYRFDYIPIRASHPRDSFNELLIAWNCAGEVCCYITSQKDEDFFSDLDYLGWRIICIGSDVGAPLNKNMLFINKLEELLINICSISKMAMDNTGTVTIGYIMKPSREEDFAKRGAFPMFPTPNGLLFVPLTFDLQLASQIQNVDAVLHKATDEIRCIDLFSPLDFPKRITFSKGIQELERYMQSHPSSYMIDPINNIYPLLDRHNIQQIILELEGINTKYNNRLRAPRCLQVNNFHNPQLRERFAEAKLSLPAIVKPQVACGVADAHDMALVFKFDDFEGLRVPLPAIVQEYVDHGSSMFKFYVLGEKVFHAMKKSMPNASSLLSMEGKNGSGAVLFNSLKSLPISKVDQPSVLGRELALDVELVDAAARWLKQRLGLTIFGFDVVIQQGTGDHVIVDINYLPSFKEVPDSEAIPAFWEAIKNSYEFMKEKQLGDGPLMGS